MSQSQFCRLPLHAICACGLAAALAGCQGRAHTDLYQQRMASEIRVLEDQLYEADYQNRVLRDKLNQCKTSDRGPAIQLGAPDPFTHQPAVESYDMGHGLDSMDDLQLPDFDEGDAVDPDALADPPTGQTRQEPSKPETQLPMAPGGPEPPGKDDLELPLIDPGEKLPPPSSEEDEVKPPGQIKLPDSVKNGAGLPEKLRIHAGLSGGERIDGKIDGMTIVVNVLDRLGKTVDLEKFDVSADLSVVILDPEREADEARIGRWDFSPGEVGKFVRSDPISGLHIPVDWKDDAPMGDEVIVHVRLRADEDDMRCEQRLKVEKLAAIAEWTPRGDALR